MQLVAEPAIRAAAVLTHHWTTRDIEAVILLLAEIRNRDELEDLILALLMVRSKSADEISRIILGSARD